MRLKIFCSGEDFILHSSMNPNSQFSELVREIERNIGTIKGATVSYGFPPRKLIIDSTTKQSTLADLFIYNGDKLSISLPAQLNNKAVEFEVPELKQAAPAAFTAGISQPLFAVSFQDLFLRIKEIPDDNSCLFHAISYVTLKQPVALLREIVAKAVLSDPIKYSDAVLGRSAESYASTITKPNSLFHF